MVFSLLDSRPRVALLRLQGVIAARSGPLSGGLNLAGLAPSLERAFGMRRLAGVFLAVNSPGGSPVQSSLIAGRIRQLADRRKVPVVACVEDAAASGGYWIACAADEIVADPASILGSIGVISASFGFQEALPRLGIERRLRTAGTEKSFLDPFRPQAPEDLARLDALLGELHAEFKDWVRQRRGVRLRAPEAEVFDGRFWTGRRAVALGLADRLGDADSEAKRRFGAKARLVPVGGRRRPLMARLLPGMAAGREPAALPAAMAAVLPAALADMLEERAAWSRLGL
ncbi:S49 family peptidase [Roseomonas sp. NAR14]|uniref:S49 family peptidase n=1 Tax=Roseomonas acroporae TaxID=2937791 RepID=A0A9X1Y6U0_9PROT|nr:S49 family peptidase [Roseomonas acroporae]MCK8783137.1 S49 family peptidase [Roseomonas acroporae]